MIATLLLLLASASIAAPAADAPSEEALIRREVERVLMARHPTETPEWWRGLGPAAPDVLIRMYGEAGSTHKRTRILQGLGWLSDPRAVEFVKGETLKADNKSLKKAGIRAVGAAGRPEDSEFLAGFLKDADPNVRLAAATALSHRGDDVAARSALDQYRGDEKVPWVLERLASRAKDAEAVPARIPDRPAAAGRAGFTGTWSGFWIAPAGDRPGLVSLRGTLKLSAESGGLAGALAFLPAPGEEADRSPYDLAEGVLKGERLQGLIVKKVNGAKGAAFSAEIRREAGRSLLRLDVPELGAVFVAERAGAEGPTPGTVAPTGPAAAAGGKSK